MKLKLMKHLCSLTQGELKQTVSKFIRSKYKKIKETGAYILAEGDIPICLVAHLDTVFKAPPTDIFYDQEARVMWSPQGLGADDRAGVYAIIDIINSGFLPHIVLTTDEEVGGIGATELVTDFKDCPFPDLKMIIELDRQGKEDSVFYDCDNMDFEKCITEYGFKPNFGTFSDISIIAPAWEVAAVNVSVGYVGEHSFAERLYVDYLLLTIARVKHILADAHKLNSYAYIPIEPVRMNTCAICNRTLVPSNAKQIEFRGILFDICDTCHKRYYGA